MDSFEEFRVDTNSVIVRSARKIFAKQLKSPEGRDIEVDGIATRGIIYNKTNPYSDTEYRTLSVSLDTKIKRGSYIFYNGDYYLNTNDIDIYGDAYQSCKITKCARILKIRGINDELEKGFPCIMSNDSYGSKQNRSNDFLSEIDTKMKIIVQENEFTKLLKRDMRFLFNNSEFDIFRVIDITTSVYPGLITLTCSKDAYRVEDDLENGFAFNQLTIDNILNEPREISISGEESIRVNREAEYTITPSDGKYTFSIDDETICEIVSSTDNSCVVKALLKDEVAILTVKGADGAITTKNIYTTR